MELSAWKLGKSKEFHSKQNKADGWGMIDQHEFLSFFMGMKLCSYPAFWPRVVNQTHGITCTLREDLCVFQKHIFLPFKDDLWSTPYMSDVLNTLYMKSLAAAAFENFLNLRQIFSSNRIAHLMLSLKLCHVEKCMFKLSFGSVFCSFSVGNDASETHDNFLFVYKSCI